MNQQFYKIKVGIEEFPVEEKDIPRIAEAMKHNDMVQLECGLFRGNAILAVCRDTEREERAFMLSSAPVLTEEEIQEKARQEKLKEQRMNCEICNHTGLKEELRNEIVVRVPCECSL